MIGRGNGVWCGCILDRVYVLFSTFLAILGVIIFGVVFNSLPKHEPLWIACLIALVFHCILVVAVLVFAYFAMSINWDGDYKYELFTDVEFGAGDGLHGVAEKGVYAIYIGNSIGSLGIFSISVSALSTYGISASFLIGLIYGAILGLQSIVSLHKLYQSSRHQPYF